MSSWFTESSVWGRFVRTDPEPKPLHKTPIRSVWIRRLGNGCTVHFKTVIKTCIWSRGFETVTHFWKWCNTKTVPLKLELQSDLENSNSKELLWSCIIWCVVKKSHRPLAVEHVVSFKWWCDVHVRSMLGEEMGMPAAVFSVCLVLISLLVIQVLEENAIT